MEQSKSTQEFQSVCKSDRLNSAQINEKKPKPHHSKKRRKETGISWFDDPYTSIKGETALWVAVITQAMMDALSNSRNPEIQFFKTEATRWLTENNKDFIEVCMLADMNPDYVRKKAKKAITSPVAWRAAPGAGKRYHERKNKKPTPKQTAETPERAIIIAGPW
ncbi:MAG: hypothetical protein LW823_02185 [Rickettsiales bacterium]|jgi:hypothetical protein|nr:hypothetical protein [Rickettsiales bacterium]